MPQDAAPIINLLGEQVALGPLRRDLIPTYTRWRNDPVVARTMNYASGPVTLEERTAWFERVSRDTASIRFTIYERQSWRAIGITNLHDIDVHHGTAEFGLMIGEAEARGQGLGTETTRLMLAYAFTSVGLHNVMLRVYAYNLAGIRAYQKAGFREFGRRQQSHWFAGQRWDEVYMQCLVSEFARTDQDPIDA
jgi:RimJ/RimL family protein N-acetyltransferase